MKTYIVSHFDSLHAAPLDINLLHGFYAIRDGKEEDAIKLLHLALKEGDKTKTDTIKRGLAAISISGRFKGNRKMEGLQEYVPLICLDIDHIGAEEARQLKKECATDPLVLAAFISPSGDGLKVFFQHTETQAEHKAVFEALADRFRHLYGIEVDMKARDIARLCFYSYDPDIYINEDAGSFILGGNKFIAAASNESNNIIATDANNIIDSESDLQKCLEWTESKLNYEEGNRNNFIFLFACTCNRKGIEKQDCLQFCLDQFDLSEEETEKTISSAYKNHRDEFGKYQVAKFTKLAKSIPTQSSAGTSSTTEKKKGNLRDQARPNLLLHTPTFPDTVYQDLPELLSKTCAYFNEPRYKDMYLLSSLTVLSHFVDQFYGIYDNSQIHPNLYCFVIAPSGVGKKNIQFASKLAEKAHNALLEQYEKERSRFEQEKMRYEELVKSKKNVIGLEFPKEPKRKTVFLPADSSHACMIQQLAQNGNRGLMFEAEA